MKKNMKGSRQKSQKKVILKEFEQDWETKKEKGKKYSFFQIFFLLMEEFYKNCMRYAKNNRALDFNLLLIYKIKLKVIYKK